MKGGKLDGLQTFFIHLSLFLPFGVPVCKDECIRQGVGEYLMKLMSPPEYIGCFRTTNTKHSRMKVPPLPRFLTESQISATCERRSFALGTVFCCLGQYLSEGSCLCWWGFPHPPTLLQLLQPLPGLPSHGWPDYADKTLL